MRRAAFPSWVTLITLVASLAAGGCRRGDDAIRAELRDVVRGKTPPPYLEGIRWKLVQRVYQQREYRPLWVSTDAVPGRTRALLESLCRAEREGLRPDDYGLADLRRAMQRVRATRKEPAPAAFAALDLEFTARFLGYGADLLAGRLDPRAVDDGWYIRSRRSSIDSTLAKTLEQDDLEAMLDPLRPGQPEYAELVDALETHRRILEGGGWPAVPGRGELRRGDGGARVEALRRRLAATGDLRDAGDAGAVFDRETEEAVARFQARHGLPMDSAVGPATLAALNVPVETRIRQIELNLERYRWLPQQFGSRYIKVNIPDYRLQAYDGGKSALDMRVVVGDEYGNATPVFADSMTFVVFRPHWYVPQSILVNEMIPRIKDDDRYLARQRLEVVDAKRLGVVLNPDEVDWDDVEDTTRLAFRVRQRAGRENSLGLVKFMFPNQFSIYLHDTPARDLFARHRRTLSHGCVRVEDPVALADWVLDGQDGWSEGKIKEAMHDPREGEGEATPAGGRTVTLERPVPVYLLYLTAFVRDGVVHFRDDPYGKDRPALARLGQPRPADRALCEELQELLGT